MSKRKQDKQIARMAQPVQPDSVSPSAPNPAQLTEFRAAQSEMRNAETAVLVARAQWLREIGRTYDGARNMPVILGYEDVITAKMYRARYERGGIAGRVVDCRPDATWRGEGELIETGDVKRKTAFELAWYALNDEHKIWPAYQRADKLASLGEYATILIGAAGNLDTELPMATSPEDLLYMQPYDYEDLVVDKFDTDIRSRRFGRPVSYQFRRGSESVTPDAVPHAIHFSRIIHIPSEGFLDDEVYGPPSLQRVWNYLNDLDKVAGGGSEAFWMRANAGTHFDLDKDVKYQNAEDFQTQITLMRQKAEAYRHQLTRWIETRGVKVTQLGSDVANFKDPVDALLMLIAGSKGIPMRLLTGSERGTLASEQDDDNWKTQISDRRTSYAGPYIARQAADRLIKYGYLPKPAEYSVRWPDIKDMSFVERLTAAESMAKLNDHGQLVIVGSEIREVIQLEPLTPEQVQEAEELTIGSSADDDEVDEVDEVDENGDPVEADEDNTDADADAESKPPKSRRRVNREFAQVNKLAAELRKGGTLSIAVRGTGTGGKS